MKYIEVYNSRQYPLYMALIKIIYNETFDIDIFNWIFKILCNKMKS